MAWQHENVGCPVTLVDPGVSVPRQRPTAQRRWQPRSTSHAQQQLKSRACASAPPSLVHPARTLIYRCQAIRTAIDPLSLQSARVVPQDAAGARYPAMTTCCKGGAGGPGYATPLEAFQKGPREKLLYVPCVVPDHSRPDYLATVDADPQSATYSQVIHRTQLAKGDEVHHSGACVCVRSTTVRDRRILASPQRACPCPHLPPLNALSPHVPTHRPGRLERVLLLPRRPLQVALHPRAAYARLGAHLRHRRRDRPARAGREARRRARGDPGPGGRPGLPAHQPLPR